MKCQTLGVLVDDRVSRPARGAWIEIETFPPSGDCRQSRPARGAWIEILMKSMKPDISIVAPRTGRVD